MSVVKEALSRQSLACLYKLKALDLSPIAAYLMNPQNHYGWSRQQVLQAIGRYKTFLFVSYLYPEVAIVPTPDVDQVWHCHILHTHKYRQDCKQLFGYFIDHQPDCEERGEVPQHNLDATFAQTQTLITRFEQYFESDTLRESQLHRDLGLELTQLLGQSKNAILTGSLPLYHRSACGRPCNYHD